MILLSLFLISPIIGTSVWDKFFFHTSISCSLHTKPSYFYKIKFFEYDRLIGGGTDDDITNWFENNIILAGGTTNSTFPGAMDGDGDQFSGGVKIYEPYAKIEHNCLEDSGDPVEVKIWLGVNYCRVGAGDCHLFVDIDLTELKRTDWKEVRIEQWKD